MIILFSKTKREHKGSDQENTTICNDPSLMLWIFVYCFDNFIAMGKKDSSKKDNPDTAKK